MHEILHELQTFPVLFTILAVAVVVLVATDQRSLRRSRKR